MMGCAALQSAATNFSHSSVAAQGMPDWHTDEKLLWELDAYEAMGSCGTLTPPSEFREKLYTCAADSPSGCI